MSDLPVPTSDWIEPPGVGQQLPNIPALERRPAALPVLPEGYTPMGGGVAWAGGAPPMSPDAARQELWNSTGVPNLQGGLAAAARGEVLPAIGQMGIGALQAAGLVAPALRGAAAVGRLPIGELLTDVAGGPRAWHGTGAAPFRQFSNDAIGSGEGAQAYGWGHYVAGNPKVAEEYRDNLSSGGDTMIEGVSSLNHPDVNANNPHIQTAVNEINAAEGNTVRATDQLTNHVELLRRMMTKIKPEIKDDFINKEISRLESARQWIVDNEHQIEWKPSGGLLHVHILPEESELLDWDRPLSEQPPGVREKIDPSHEAYAIAHSGLADPTGEQFYKALARLKIGDLPFMNMADRNPRGASQALHEAGIPGIRYLDAGSRAAGEGTHNYVIFHPDNLRILSRNGIPLEPVDHDPFVGE